MTYITVKVPTNYQGRIVLEIKPKIPVSISLKPTISDTESESSTRTPSPNLRNPNWKTQPRDAKGRFIKRQDSP
jgi:hypothetical protein